MTAADHADPPSRSVGALDEVDAADDLNDVNGVNAVDAANAGDPGDAGDAGGSGGDAERSLRPIVLAAVACGVVLWCWPRGALWLDEAQSVAIARRSPSGIVDGLRADGAPPLYYAVLHAWMELFGASDRAVRALSTVFGAAAVVSTAALARRVSGVTAAWTAAGVMALHPFLVRYASETRMYTLVMTEAALALLLTDALLRSGARRHWLGLAITTCAAALTHYWAISAALAGILLSLLAHELGVRGRRRARWSWSRPVAVASAIAAGLVATAPWWPVVRFQSARTGTPWSDAPSIVDALRVVFHRDIGRTWIALVTSIVGGILLGLGTLELARRARSAPGSRGSEASPALATRQTRGVGLTAGWIAAHVWVAAAVAFAVTRTTGSAYVSRYTSVFFPGAVIVVVHAVRMLPRPRLRTAALVAVLVLGAATALVEAGSDRTRAERFATALRAGVAPRDTVLFCPDQLGPSIARLLAREPALDVRAAVYPTGDAPDRVDWIDYRERHESASASRFLDRVVGREAPGAVWLVLSQTYPPTQAACTDLFDELRSRFDRADVVIPDDPDWRDHDQLWRFAPASSAR